MSFPFADGEFLTLRVGGGPTRPERLLLIGRPGATRSVHVHEWTSNSWNTEGSGYDTDPAVLLGEIEEAFAARAPVSEDMHRVRHWLTGIG